MEIDRGEEGNDWHYDTEEQAVDEYHQAVALIIAERKFVVVFPVDTFSLVPFGLQVEHDPVASIEKRNAISHQTELDDEFDIEILFCKQIKCKGIVPLLWRLILCPAVNSNRSLSRSHWYEQSIQNHEEINPSDAYLLLFRFGLQINERNRKVNQYWNQSKVD